MDNKSDSEIAAVLAHEVKNPVAIIKANLDYIKTSVPDKILKNIEVIDNALLRINKIVEGYRLMSVKTGNNELIYIEDMLMDIIEDYNISKPEINFVYDCDSEINIYGSYDKLSILFYNIYKNAVEAIKSEGIIKTVAYYENNKVVIKISDNGIGIEDIQAIGTPYYTTKQGGTGLGVLICKNIVEEHNGELYFENMDKGSIVTVILPVNINNLSE
jgi:two-component sensor histidine kinase